MCVTRSPVGGRGGGGLLAVDVAVLFGFRVRLGRLARNAEKLLQLVVLVGQVEVVVVLKRSDISI